MSPKKNITTQRQIIKALVLVPTVLVLLAATWVSGASIVENIHFARATDQILRLVSTTHDVAASDKNFATQPGEDLLNTLARGGLAPGTIDGKPVTLPNPWEGAITATTAALSMMRIETAMPARDCRRLALFFARNGADLGLRVMEAHEDVSKVWRRFYDRAANPSASDSQLTEAACGQAPRVTLALVFALR